MAGIARRQLIRWAAAGAAASGAWSGQETGHLRIGWVDDRRRHAETNKARRNYWNAYVPEILDELGLRAESVSPGILSNTKQLAEYSTLLISDLDVSKTGTRAAANLEKWVRGGGVLIALATEGVHELCGNRQAGRIDQPGDEFTCAATFALANHSLTTGIHSYLQPQQRLLIFSEAQKVKAEHSVELARLYDVQGQDTACAAITGRELGKGLVYHFGFSVPQTMWVLHQGRPIDRDYDGDGWLRRSDAIVRRPHAEQVAYADEIALLLQNLIGARPHAFIHQFPPMPAGAATRVPDALFFWGGDDEGSADGIQLASSNWMRERGLPYHLNIMPRHDGTFGLSVEHAQKILANGHELAPHFNFIDNFELGMGFSREDVLSQAAAFRERFGEFLCSVNHWNRWTGWVEPAKWIHEAGGRADNSFVGVGSPPRNNVNTLGFSFGTAFPFWLYDDWRGGNRRIDFLEEPRSAYECGYLGKQKTDFAMSRKAVEMALRYHLTMNMFYHPIYIATYPSCRAAIEDILQYIDERKATVLHMGHDELYRWWKARSETRVRVAEKGDSLMLEVESSYPAGVIVKIPLGRRSAKSATVGGVAVTGMKNEQMFGQNWALIPVPSGKVRLDVAIT